MKVAVVVRTWNVVENHRKGLLLRTLDSIRQVGPVTDSVHFVLVDNGSDEVTLGFLRTALADGTLGDFTVRISVGQLGRGKPGLGVNCAVASALELNPDLVCFSDDDIEWTPGWLAPVIWFFEAAPPDLVLLSGILEPEWEWNTPRKTIEHGGVRALVRDSVPGASWMFRASDWPKLGPVVEGVTHDIDGCIRIREAGLRMAAMDLADHIGAGHSTLGNTVAFGKPVDREKWGV